MNAVWLIILALILLAMSAQPFFAEKRKYHYKAKRYLMTRAESDLYKKLSVAYARHYLIVPQVRLSSLVDERIKGQNWRGALTHVNQKSVDFVVLDKHTFRVLAVIECDDSTHNRKDRIRRDIEVNRILSEAGIPCYHLHNSLSKTVDSIKKDIDKQKLKH